MKAVWNAILVGCEVCDFNFKNVLKFCKGYGNDEITERIEVIHLHIKFILNSNTHKIISKVNINLKLCFEMEKYRQNGIHNGCTNV